MFRIADGRECFYQWDLDRQLIVEDPTITEVHFCNRTDDCSLVVEVKEEDGLRVANVPNIILQKSFDIRAFGYDGKATLHEKTFKVKPRTQPADYMYTETVIKSVEEILTAAEQVETITDDFYEYVEERKLGLIDDGQGNVELTAVEGGGGGNVDLEDYYTKEETEAKIEEAIAAIEIPESGGGEESVYYLDLASITSWTNIGSDLVGYPSDELKAKIAECAEKVIAGETISIFISSGSNYVRAWAPAVFNKFGKNVNITPTPQFADLTPSRFMGTTNCEKNYYSYTLKLDANANEWLICRTDNSYSVADKQYVDDAIANIEIPEGGGGGSTADLTNYYTKEETDGLIADIDECDTYFFNPYEVEWQTGLTPTPPPSDLLEFAQRILAGDRANLYIAYEFGSDIRWVPAEFAISSNQVLVWRSIALTDVGKEVEYPSYKVYENAGTWRIVKSNALTTKLIADKTYVDNAIQTALNGIATAEGGAY